MSARVLEACRRVLSLLLLLALVVGIPVALWVLSRAYLPDQFPTWTQVTAALSGPDTGAVFAGFLVVVGWVAWAVFAVSVAVEIPAQLRGVPAPRLPGLGSMQQLAGLLVAAVLGVGGAPLLSWVAAPAYASPPLVSEQPAAPVEEPAATGSSVGQAGPDAAAAPGPQYTVQPRDTLGRIAARTLGDWERFDEIFELNRGRPQPDGRELTDARVIRPGWVLTLPADAASQPAAVAGQVVVESGDTLSEIAEEEGLPGWRPIFVLNAGEQQPGGRLFTDPHLIFPGQVLDIPGDPQPDEEGPATSEPEAPAPAEPSVPPPTTDAPPTEQPATPSRAGDAAEQSTDPGEESPTGLAATLAGGGALLAAGIGAALLVQRRQRLRRRRAGRMLAPTPPTLIGAEASVLVAASAGVADFTALDVALRSLAVALSDQPGAQLPDVVGARLSGHRLDLRLHAPTACGPPPPWTADETGWWWSLDLAADIPVDPDRARGRLAPYPGLVSVGSEGGQRWLLDLERIGILRLSGPLERCEDFARHLAAELAVNSWSDLLHATVVGFGTELVDLNPERLRHAEDLVSVVATLHATLRQYTDGADTRRDAVLDGRLHATAGDGWMPEILLVAPDAGGGDRDLAVLTAAMHQHGDRTPLAVVLGEEPGAPAEGWLLTLTDDGRLLIPGLDLSLQARQLTAQEAADIAALLAFERGADDAAIPAAAGDQPWQTYTDATGALLENVTLPRGPDRNGEGPAGVAAAAARAQWTPAVPGSVLPQDTGIYVQSSAVTVEDVEALARRAPTDLRDRVEDDLEQLDRDLADWWDPDCSWPRLTLLGPIALRAHGDETAVVKSGLRRRYEEVVAYLATRTHGATGDEAAAALRPDMADPVTARAYVHRVAAGARAWLGTDPVTGEKYLSSGHRGAYSLRNVLVDAELFRQLRCRAGVRGGDGIRDLSAALELVSGLPFGQRPSGYEWLQGLDLAYTAGVCDVAHLVVTSALADGDLETARAASQTALLVAPEDEKVLVDAMWVAFRDGNQAEGEAFVARIVAVNDGEDEMDLHMSTAETIARARREFVARAS
ncbi:LysM peptidoglycan-binding domain-containing protein [Blastococcus tunisiensis]|uniref:DNA-binding transcriptional activator of the SARP family n=1 Tax=Blastococcus tunisiensis TaxID=1798228 RepID=A0A1I2EQ62_9ACTN|nr:LysM peptidoglycan-binding domain-containing protein [Blastococcus sp. DSM 46838]SFE94979.1 DNA-binding transcriptional activator of the SARP family [Blastococcus sp. DSM 46838]